MARFPKPAEGSWTQHYPELGTGPVSYADSISPEFYELEREAIFERAWLEVGRVEQLPRNGSYFTKEIAVANTSIIVVRDRTTTCARSTTSAGTAATSSSGPTSRARRRAAPARQFACKYHGWRYGLDGGVHVRAAGGRVLRPRQGRLRPRARPLRRLGRVRVRPPRTASHARSLREFLGPMITALEDYPFDQLTERYAFPARRSPPTGSCSSTRSKSSTTRRSCTGASGPRHFDAPMQSRLRGAALPTRRAASHVHHARHPARGTCPTTRSSRSERLLRSGLFGPWDAPEPCGHAPRRDATRAATIRGGVSLFVDLPEPRHPALGARLVPHVPPLADVLDTHIFELESLLRTAAERTRGGRAAR